MLQEKHSLDKAGNPAGGATSGTGIKIDWQRGPLGRGKDRKKPSGAFVETVIQAAIGRLEFYEQKTAFGCKENKLALRDLKNALGWLEKRAIRREKRGVEGTHAS